MNMILEMAGNVNKTIKIVLKCPAGYFRNLNVCLRFS
jgi:hypothetical protein